MTVAADVLDILDAKERAALGEAAGAAVAHHAPISRTRDRAPLDRLDRGAWVGLSGELGPAAMLLAEDRGGHGLSVAHAAIVAEAAGAALAPLPVVTTMGLVVPLVDALGTDDQRRRLLPAILSGGLVVGVPSVLPHVDPRSGADGDGRPAAGPRELDTVWGADADLVLVVDGDRALLLDPSGATVTTVAGTDTTRPRARLSWPAPAAEVLGGDDAGAGDEIARVLDTARVLMAAEAVGAARAVVRETVAYVSVREQFGHPVGSFQAVAHRAADLHGEVESAAAAVQGATVVLQRQDTSPDDRHRASLVAAVRAVDAAAVVAREGLHLHGGIGFTAEHDAHLYLKRALDDRQRLGRRDVLLERLAAVIPSRSEV